MDNRPWYKLTWSKAPGELIIISVCVCICACVCLNFEVITRYVSFLKDNLKCFLSEVQVQY